MDDEDDSFYDEIVMRSETTVENFRRPADPEVDRFSDDSFDEPIFSAARSNGDVTATRQSSEQCFVVHPQRPVLKELPSNSETPSQASIAATPGASSEAPPTTPLRPPQVASVASTSFARHGSDNSFFHGFQSSQRAEREALKASEFIDDADISTVIHAVFYPSSPGRTPKALADSQLTNSFYAQPAAPGELILLRRRVDNLVREKEKVEKDLRTSMVDQQSRHESKIKEKEEEMKRMKLEIEELKAQCSMQKMKKDPVSMAPPSPIIPLATSTPTRFSAVPNNRPMRPTPLQNRRGQSGFMVSSMPRPSRGDISVFRHRRPSEDEPFSDEDETFELMRSRDLNLYSTPRPKIPAESDEPPAKRRPMVPSSSHAFRSPVVSHQTRTPAREPPRAVKRPASNHDDTNLSDALSQKVVIEPERHSDVDKADIRQICRSFEKHAVQRRPKQRSFENDDRKNSSVAPSNLIQKKIVSAKYLERCKKAEKAKGKKSVNLLKEQNEREAASKYLCLRCNIVPRPRPDVIGKMTFDEDSEVKKRWEVEEEKRVEADRAAAYLPFEELMKEQLAQRAQDANENSEPVKWSEELVEAQFQAREELREECRRDFLSITGRTLRQIRAEKLRTLEVQYIEKIRNREDIEVTSFKYLEDDYIWTSDDSDSDFDDVDLLGDYCECCRQLEQRQRRQSRRERALLRLKIKCVDLVADMSSMTLDFQPAKNIFEKKKQTVAPPPSVQFIDLTGDDVGRVAAPVDELMEDDFDEE